MEFLEKSHSDLITLPKLKKHFIFSTALLLVLIVMGQSYQDYHRRQELYDAKQLQNYHQQAQLTANLIHQVLSMRDANYVAINSAAAEVMEVTKQLMSSEST
jgi:hypothetical protein